MGLLYEAIDKIDSYSSACDVDLLTKSYLIHEDDRTGDGDMLRKRGQGKGSKGHPSKVSQLQCDRKHKQTAIPISR